MLPPPLRSRQYWLFWASQAVSNLADGFFRIALPLLAVTLSREPLLVSGVAVALTLPWLVFSLPVGACIDYWDRRTTMVLANGARVLLLLIGVMLLVRGEMNIFVLYLMAFGLGLLETIADTAAGALLPALVPVSQLEVANARLLSVQTIMNQFIGPSLGTVLVTIGMVYAFGSSGVLYALALLLLLLVQGFFTPEQQSPRRLCQDIRAGLRFIWQTAGLRLLIVLLAGLNLSWSAYYALIVLYAVAPGPLGFTPIQYGLVIASIGVGGAVGAFLAEFVQKLIHRKWFLFGDMIGSLLLFTMTIIVANIYVYIVSGVLAGVLGSLSNVALVSLRQRLVPNELLGRVGGASRLFTYGALSVGAVGAGILARYIEIYMVFLCCIMLVMFLLLLCVQQFSSLTKIYASEHIATKP